MKLKRIFCLSACVACAITIFTASAFAQRDRIVKTTGSQPVNQPPAPKTPEKTTSSRPTLTSPIVIVGSQENKPLVQRTASSKPLNAPSGMAAGHTAYGMSVAKRMDQAIKERYGKPYVYGSTGPNSYDCSGFVWSVFTEAGVPNTRGSVRSLWAASEPVYGDDRFKFGTLVFLNGLGHVGIVADDNGFYHASSSKGIMYSPFAGYWSNRIVGYRRLKPEAAKQLKNAPVIEANIDNQ